MYLELRNLKLNVCTMHYIKLVLKTKMCSSVTVSTWHRVQRKVVKLHS